MKIKTASDLKYMVEQSGHDSHFFTRHTMRFFGDTMKNYGVRQPVEIQTNMDETVPAYELVRRNPVHPDPRNRSITLSESAWFHATTFKRVFPKGGN